MKFPSFPSFPPPPALLGYFLPGLFISDIPFLGFLLFVHLQLVQPVDRMIASHFANNFIHLHSTSMFLLDAFLEIEEIQYFQINIESFNIPVKDMIRYFQVVQKAGRPLLIRGSVEEEEMRILLDSLDPRGLYLHIVVKDIVEIESLRPLLGM